LRGSSSSEKAPLLEAKFQINLFALREGMNSSLKKVIRLFTDKNVLSAKKDVKGL